MKSEIWKPIQNYNSLYEISNLGNIKSLKKKYPNRAEKIKQFNKNNEYIKTFNSSREASKLLNISETSISNCVNGYSKTAGGFIWKR